MVFAIIMIFLSFILIAIFLAIFNRLYPRLLSRWFCDKLGWHVKPDHLYFDGVNLQGICPRCYKKVMQDSQGNWF